MWRRAKVGLVIATVGLAVLLLRVHAEPPAPAPDEPAKVEPVAPPKSAPSQVTGVTVYQNSALVTREVEVPEGTGSFELVVTPLPPQTIDSSLYSEGTEGIRVLTTRYRMQPIQEDTREEVRKVEEKLKELQKESESLQSEITVNQANVQMLSKLENFTGANLQNQTEKGNLNSEGIMALSKYVMESRTDKSKSLVLLQQKVRENQEQNQFFQRKLQEVSAGTNKTERDAVIVVDKKDPAPGKVRLNYLVTAASWRPEYKFRAGKENQPIQLEYMAAIIQQSGEDWTNAAMILSTAEPMLNAAPPDLKMLDVAVVPRPASTPLAAGGAQGQPQSSQPQSSQSALDYDNKALGLRRSGLKAYTDNNAKEAVRFINDAAAQEQAKDLLATKDEEVKANNKSHPSGTEGPSVTYHLETKLTVPSRQDEQVVEVAKIDMTPEYFYKAVPVLTAHVYRLANLTNKSEYVLLPGEATMYIGSDFVGRATLPLVAIGEQFTAGFGVDPQLQVQRQMIDKSRTTQGDNQVLNYQYRILISSYKPEAVRLQLWDRLPHTDTEALSVSLVKATPEVSTDALYLRESKPDNLLRWDLNVEPAMNSEKAIAVTYEFKLELGRQMILSNFLNLMTH